MEPIGAMIVIDHSEPHTFMLESKRMWTRAEVDRSFTTLCYSRVQEEKLAVVTKWVNHFS